MSQRVPYGFIVNSQRGVADRHDELATALRHSGHQRLHPAWTSMCCHSDSFAKGKAWLAHRIAPKREQRDCRYVDRQALDVVVRRAHVDRMRRHFISIRSVLLPDSLQNG